VLVFLASLLLVKSLFKDTGAPVRVPDVRGRQIEVAEAMLREDGLEVGEVNRVFSDRPVDEVIDQDPLPQFSIASGGEVNLTVSKGIERVQIPDVTGQQLEDAKRELEARGLKLGKVTEKEQVGPPGRVLEVSPRPGTTVNKGSTVAVTVISGQITMPDLFGKTFEQARSELEALGFSNIQRQDVASDNPDEAGTVVGQDPARGTKAARDAVVTLRIAQPPPTTPPPTTAPPTTAPPTGSPTVPPLEP
jgi:serine/threonine-protein kinase